MKLKRIIGMVLVIAAGFLLQNSILPAIGQIHYIPNILVITVCAFGLTSGPYYGMLAGVLCGLLMDSVFGHRIGYYSLAFLYMGYWNGVCQKYFYFDNLAVPLLACGLSDLGLGFYIFVVSFLLRNRTNLPFYMMNIILPELISTIVAALILFRVIALINGKMAELEKRRSTKFV